MHLTKSHDKTQNQYSERAQGISTDAAPAASFRSRRRPTVHSSLFFGLAGGGFFVLFLPFLKTLVLALIFFFTGESLRGRFKNRPWARRLIYLAAGVTLLVVTYLVGAVGAELVRLLKLAQVQGNSSEFLSSLTSQVPKVLRYIQPMAARFSSEWRDLDALARDVNSLLGTWLEGVASILLGGLATMPELLLQVAFFFFALILAARRRVWLKNFLGELLSRDAMASTTVVYNIAVESSYQTMISVMLVAALQGSVVTIGAVIVGMPHWELIFLVATCCSLLPALGVLPVTGAITLYAFFFLGKWAAIVSLIFAVVASLVDNLVKPILISGDADGLNPVVSFFAALGGILVFGFSGLFIGPFLTLMAAQLANRAIREKRRLASPAPRFDI